MRIILDNGHGNDTAGKRSQLWDNGKQLFEWEFNRAVVVKLHTMLGEDDYDSEILVPEAYDIPIRERAERANEIHASTPSILISVHGNAAPKQNTGPSGIETFYYSKAGKVLATALQGKLVDTLQWKNRGVKQCYEKITINRGKANEKEIMVYKIALLKYTNMVAVLTENGFYTNFGQCMEMLKPEVMNMIAHAHYEGIKQYLFHLNQ
jgi:N-acetylmuramoyl-L-alanine amidase